MMRAAGGAPLRAGRLAVCAAVALAAGCGPRAASLDRSALTDLALRYAAAWSSQDPDRLASFYSEDGALIVNNGTPAVGRSAVRTTAAGFMAGFPDMRVTMDSVTGRGDRAVFHWTWTGTNTGPGGTGRAVRISGYEEWTLSPDGRITESRGHYDEAEYRRQVTGEGGLPPAPQP